MKRILTIQDISCIGKCSLTAVLPVISVLGSEACVLPTAVLSAHSGIDGFTFFDMTGELEHIINHWKNKNIIFDAVYSGYLGSAEQAKLVEHIYENFGSDKLILVDPVMGDGGRLYSGIDKAIVKGMKKLCSCADIITPNMTEAAFLTGKEYKKHSSMNEVKSILRCLCDMGARKAVVSGIDLFDGVTGAVTYDREADEFSEYLTEKIPGVYLGTGDLFAGCILGLLMRGENLSKSVEIACGFISESIKASLCDKNSRSYGVNFEEALPWLVEKVFAEK